MPPIDSTPNMNTGSFELLYSLQAYDKIPVSEYKSKTTGLTVVIAQVDGPIVNGFFCLVTEAFDDDGLPHTLEHLIFLGSEQYPYKGVLDLLANRCLASGTNAWTDIDHTCYTMETAGSGGFLALMPIFLEHILYPVLSEEGFITEVHHVTPDGDDAGVVYCEMQGRENSAESRLHLLMAKNMYPGKCGYSSETGGLMKNLRESTTNKKVRNYHKEFYRPENLKVIITGQVNPEEVFRALQPLEQKILLKGDRGEFQRPWQNPVPPLPESKDFVVYYPSDEEKNGLFSVAWRGPSSVADQYTLTATSILLKFLTEFSVSPLQKEFVEIADPFASKVTYNLYENSESCLYVMFEGVPLQKMKEIKGKLQAVLKAIIDNADIDMDRMKSIINRHKLESLSSMENNPHHTIAFMIIGHMLYGNTRDDLEQRVNPLTDLNKLLKEPKEYWIKLLEKYFVGNKYIAIECYPSKEEQAKLAKEEKERIEEQVKNLGEDGLKEKEDLLEKAIDFNNREPPEDMLTSVEIPNLSSINFHNINRYKSDIDGKNIIDLSDTPVFTYFDNVKTCFVYMFVHLATSEVPSDLRIYLPLLLESLLESPIKRGDKIIPYEEVVSQLNDDTVSTSAHIGLGASRQGLFRCGSFSQTASLTFQVEVGKYETGLNWLREVLYKTVFTPERLKIIAAKMNNAISESKRSGRDMVSYTMKGLRYQKDSNIINNGILAQQKFLSEVLDDIEKGKGQKIIDAVERLRNIITEPKNVTLYFAGNLNGLPKPVEAIKKFLPEDVKPCKPLNRLNPIPDYTLLNPNSEDPLKGCIIGMGCLESSYFCQTTNCISSYNDPDLPALLLYLQYLIQAEGPIWKQVRGKGFAYGYTMMAKIHEGLLYLVFSRATNVVGAYKETKDIVADQINSKNWDTTLLDAAKSSLIFEIIDEEKSIGSVISLSVFSYFQGVDYTYNRTLLKAIEKVTEEDLNRVGDKYVAQLFEPDKVKTAVVTDPSKAEEIATNFKKLDLDLTVYPSLEESFLNN